ncbi:MAG: HAMP domain-containing sensor histidine kinase, partial [Ferruginibacter sp.]
IDKTNQLTELESDYRIEKKNNELTKKDAEVVKQKSQRNLLLIIALSILAVLVGLAFFYSRVRGKNKLLQQKNIQISEQKNELQTLNHVKDRLFSIISHDLRNPLVTLRSYLMLADNDALSAEKKHLFKVQTMNAVSQTGDMLDNLLAWANVQIKNTRATIIPINLKDLVTDAVSNVKAQAFQKQIEIVQQINVEMIPGDYDILMIALRNLLTNAIKYSAEKKEILISCLQDNNRIFLSVKDEGVGLSAEQINYINKNENSTTKGTKGEKGSGLGLFLIKELLKNMNALLLIESTPGQGSTFTISLPAL